MGRTNPSNVYRHFTVSLSLSLSLLPSFYFLSFFLFTLLEVEPRALIVVGKHSP
jgi:hypothetical protein